MPRTLKTEITEAAIKRHAADPDIRELNDPRLPLRLRYGKDRAGASWHLVRHVDGKDLWRKVGSWPALTTKAIKEALPRILARYAHDPGYAATVSGYATLNDLFVWYETRLATNRQLSRRRIATVRSAIRKHLRPKVGALALIDCTRAALDAQLIWPLQGQCSLAHTRLVWSALRVICKQAAKLQLVEVDPLLGMQFSDFSSVAIRAKAMRIRPEAIGPLLAQLAERFDERPTEVMLVALQLAHGTRINETRLARWQHVNGGGWWHIPAENAKTREALNIPITAQLQGLLERYRTRQLKAGYSGVWLFPGKRQGQPLSERAALEVYARYSAGEWSSHDLRKLARTTWLDLGIDYLIGELLLNHKLKDLNAAYIHTHAEERKRDGLQRWHAWLDARGFAALHAKTPPRRAAANETPETAPAVGSGPLAASIS